MTIRSITHCMAAYSVLSLAASFGACGYSRAVAQQPDRYASRSDALRSSPSRFESAVDDDVVHIDLVPNVRIPPGTVFLADVAQMRGGSARTQENLKRLDVAELRDGRDTDILTRDVLELRLRIAGIPPRDYWLTGADETYLSAIAFEWSDESVLDLLRTPVAERLGIDVNDLELRMSRVLPALPERIAAIPTLRMDAQMPTTLRAGPLTIRIGLYDGPRMVHSLSVPVEALIYREVFVVSQPMQRGDVIAAEHFGLQRLPLNAQTSLKAAREIVGRTVNASLRTGDIVLNQHLLAATAARNDTSSVLVRSRDKVIVTATRGALRVTMHDAQALEQGRMGDLIRVRNPKGGQVLNGRVTGPNRVEVLF